jgi:prepilin-type N-terminal cleavage/methylation domain-containing protein
MALAKFNSSSRGFSLVEVLVSMGLLTVVSLGVAQLFGLATRANYTSKGQTTTTVLAEQKIEELRSLMWGFDLEGMGLPLSDTTTNLTVFPHTSTGTGLNPTPADSLEENTPGYVDYLDVHGAWAGNGANPPGNAVYIRRWSIQPLPTNPNNTLVLQGLVTTVSTEALRTRVAAGRTRQPGDSLIVTVKTRKAS